MDADGLLIATLEFEVCNVKAWHLCNWNGNKLTNVLY